MNICQCGCDQALPKQRKRTDRPPAKFIKGHNFNIRSLPDRNCPVCEKSFHCRHDEQVYCSLKCARSIIAAKRRRRVNCICQICGVQFEAKRYRASAKYCTKECWEKRNPPRQKTCQTCNKGFQTYDDGQVFCSQSCAGKSRTGDKANAYKHGIAAQTKRGQLGGELAKWRKAVYKRDNYTCQYCRKTKCELQAHHIKPLAKYPELALDIDNGVTVCLACHEKIHGRKIGHKRRHSKSLGLVPVA